MKDNKRIIMIDGKNYSVDRTLDGSPAIFQHIGNGECQHIDDNCSRTNIQSIVAGNEDAVIIVARKMRD